MQKRVLIVTADDFGYSIERNDGIVRCFQQGAVTRTSLLVNGLATANAVNQAGQCQLPVGLHLNLTEGLPVSPVVPSLLNGAYMRGKMGFRDALWKGEINLQEVKEEIKAQIEGFRILCGCLPPFVDGHQHVHILLGVREIFSEVLEEFGISETRLPSDSTLAACDWMSASESGTFLRTVVENANEAAQCFKQKNLRFADHFLGLATMGSNMSIDRLQCLLTTVFHPSAYHTFASERKQNSASEAVSSCELMVHPGFCTASQSGGCGDGPDAFAMSPDREHEMDVLLGEGMMEFYRKNNIKLSPFLRS